MHIGEEIDIVKGIVRHLSAGLGRFNGWRRYRRLQLLENIRIPGKGLVGCRYLRHGRLLHGMTEGSRRKGGSRHNGFGHRL